MKKRIGILMGGYSDEAHISKKSAQTILEALNPERFVCSLIDVRKDGWFVLIDGTEARINLNDLSYLQVGEVSTFDTFFNAIHGTPGEDGKVQGLLDMVGTSYAGCSVLSSALTFNKGACNTFLKGVEGITTAPFAVSTMENPLSEAHLLSTIGVPCFVKPCRAGSSFGISKVTKLEDLGPALDLAFQHDSQVMIEKMVSGVEVSVGVYSKAGNTIALPVTEIVPDGDFFDYNAKYQGASQEITPARISAEQTKNVQDLTRRAYDALALDCMARIDFIIEDGVPYLIEVNTVPGLSPESILPQQIKEAGMTLGEFFENLVDQA